MKKLKIMKNNLKKYRKWADITQIELSEELEISPNTLAKIENKHILPKYIIRRKICDYFNIRENQMWEENKNEK